MLLLMQLIIFSFNKKIHFPTNEQSMIIYFRYKVVYGCNQDHSFDKGSVLVV